MKKFFFQAIFISILCAGGTVSWGQGIQAGNQQISLLGGGAWPVRDSGISSADLLGDTVANASLDWGGGAFTYGVQYEYALSPHWALGAEYNGALFSESSYTRSYFHDEVYWGNSEIKNKMQIQNFWVSGRYTFNPQAALRVYVPIGVGGTVAQADVRVQEVICSGGFIESQEHADKKKTLSLSYYIGLGIEGDINDRWGWGIEGRYQRFQFDYGKFLAELDTQNLDYLSWLVKLSYKF